MRQAFLFRSISRVLGDAEGVHDAAYMWRRHRWMLPYAAFAFGAVVLFAPVAGIDEWPSRIVIGLAAVGVAVNATTEYRVLAQVESGLALFQASRIRQVATSLQERLPAGAGVAPVGGTMLATDWEVNGRRYTVPRRSEQAMHRMADAAGD